MLFLQIFCVYTLHKDYKMKEKSYIVAGYVFCLRMEAGAPLWECLSAYAPFVTKNFDGKGHLFTLTLREEVEMKDTIPVIVNHDSREEAAKIDIYRIPSGHLFEMYPAFCKEMNCRLRTNENFSEAEAALSGMPINRMFGLNSVLMLLFALSTAKMDTVLMHASAVMSGGKAYLFLGRSGTGKSTHSRLWQQYIKDVEPLNDDHPIVRIDDSGRAIAYGSPWSGKTPCYRNLSAPVGGIVRIRQAKENRIKRISPVEAYASLMTSCSGMTWNSEMAEGRNRTMQGMIAAVPCYTLECLPDEEATRLCEQTVRKEERCNE
jgi:hypothetical protein